MPETQFDQILDRIEEKLESIDLEDVLKVVGHLLRVAKIAFRFIPMTADQKELFKAITEAVEELLKGF